MLNWTTKDNKKRNGDMFMLNWTTKDNKKWRERERARVIERRILMTLIKGLYFLSN
jgi:hypothetical protein